MISKQYGGVNIDLRNPEDLTVMHLYASGSGENLVVSAVIMCEEASVNRDDDVSVAAYMQRVEELLPAFVKP